MANEPDHSKGYIDVNIEDIMHSAYLQYSLSVNIGRAIPDVRDGLKPGNRRILYAMRQLGLTHTHAYTKCAKVVGEVIGNYHPHGDQSIYDTMVRMAQDFSQRYMLIDGQGNFGSIDGDAAAAYRYTECRLKRLAEELLTDLDKDTVEMIPNFDESLLEPTVLPAGFPNLLVNGSTGIGVGMATNIPPHNLGEVIDGIVKLIDEPATTSKELMMLIQGPDFPTGAMIIGRQPIIDLYETGHGIIKVRAKATIDETETGRERIVVTEIPYMVNKESLQKRIAELVNKKVIPGIFAMRDESSSRTGIRLVIEVKNNERADIVLNQLYKHSQLQTSFGATFMVVSNNRPVTMNLSQLLQAYIDHRLEIITRRSQFELEKAQAKAHILEGLIKAVDNIDIVIAIIRSARDREDAAGQLIIRFELSRKQTMAILEMRLHQLTSLAREELIKDYNETMSRIEYLKSLLATKELRIEVVKQELIDIKNKYSDPRRTEIIAAETDINIEDLITRSICAITISNTGYIKRLPLDEFRVQRRGGVGVSVMQTKEDDFVRQVLSACTHDYIMFFTNKGLMHWLKVYEIPEGMRAARGKAIVNLVGVQQDEQIRALITVTEVDVDDLFIILATRRGIIKKMKLSLFRKMRKKGIIAVTLKEGDDVIDVRLARQDDQVMLFTSLGKVCRCPIREIPVRSRIGIGVIGIRLRGGDEVVSLLVVNPGDEILNITSRGMGKRSQIGSGISEEDAEIGGGYRLTRRGGTGVRSMSLREGDRVMGASLVQAHDELMITTMYGNIVRINTDEIRTIGRSSKGVRLINLREGDTVMGMAIIQQMDDEDGQGTSEAGDDRIAAASVPPALPPATPELPEPDED